jgi:hypothetical protein
MKLDLRATLQQTAEEFPNAPRWRRRALMRHFTHRGSGWTTTPRKIRWARRRAAARIAAASRKANR